MSEPTIPFWHTKLGTTESDAVARTIAAGCLSQGRVTVEFERALAVYLQVPHVIATTSGTTALYLAAAALGIGAGDEVIVPDRTFIATAHAMMLTGARVRLVDVEPHRTIIDAAAIEAAITPRTKAIVPVHLNGNAADMPAIRALAARYGLFVIEDTAQAFGSASTEGYLGTNSNAGCFSLGVTKLITTGQGGFAVTHDAALAERMRRFRSHGVYDTFEATYERFGLNLKFTDVQAAIGVVQLTKAVEKIDAHRRQHAYYSAALDGLDFIAVSRPDSQPGCFPLWTEALVSERDAVVALLAERGVQVRPYLPSLHIAPHLGSFDPAAFPNSTLFARYGIFLPSGPDVPEHWLERVVAAVRDIASYISTPLSDALRFAEA